VLLETVDEFVVRCRLAVNIDRRAEIVKNLVEGAEPRVVAPAVDVGSLDIEDFFPEPLGDELRDAGLTGAAGSGDDGRVGGFTIRDWFENAGEVVDFGVTMLNLPRNEPSTEYASIADHPWLIDWYSG